MQAPLHTFWNAFKGAFRSTCFLSTFVGIYQVHIVGEFCRHYPIGRILLLHFLNFLHSECWKQSYICLQRKIAVKDHKAVYWFGGAIAALSVLLEKKSRRTELALYVLPRAADSLWYILVNRHLLPKIRHAEVSVKFYL